MELDIIAHLRKHQDPISAPSGLCPVQVVAFDHGQIAFPGIFNLLRAVELPPDGWVPPGGWQFQMWSTAMPLAVNPDVEGAIYASTRGLTKRPPFQADGFMIWIGDRLFQVDHLAPRLSHEPLNRRHVFDLTPPPDRLNTFGQQVHREVKEIREVWESGRVEESRTRMSIILGMYQAMVADTNSIASLGIIERIDWESGAKALQELYMEIKPDWDRRPPQWK